MRGYVVVFVFEDDINCSVLSEGASLRCRSDPDPAGHISGR